MKMPSLYALGMGLFAGRRKLFIIIHIFHLGIIWEAGLDGVGRARGEIETWGNQKKVTWAHASGRPLLSRSSSGAGLWPSPQDLHVWPTCVSQREVHLLDTVQAVSIGPHSQTQLCCCSPLACFSWSLIWAQGSEEEARWLSLWNHEKLNQEWRLV